MVARRANLSNMFALATDAAYHIADFSWRAPAPVAREQETKLGDYTVDYTPLTDAQIKDAKAVCAEHIARSKRISVKRGL